MIIKLLTLTFFVLFYTTSTFAQVYHINSSGISFDLPNNYTVIIPSDPTSLNKIDYLSKEDKEATLNEMKQKNIALYAIDDQSLFEFAIVYKIDENSKMTWDNSYLTNYKNNDQELSKLKEGLEKTLGQKVYNFEIKEIKGQNFLVAQSTILRDQYSTFTKHYLTVINGASFGLNAFYHGKNWKDFPHYELEKIFFSMKLPNTIEKEPVTKNINNAPTPTTYRKTENIHNEALYKGLVGAGSAVIVLVAIYILKFLKNKFIKKSK